MAELDHATAALRIFGDDLDPDEVSLLLSATPSDCWRKGHVHTYPGGQVVRKTGAWILEASSAGHGNLDRQVQEICGKTTSDSGAWKILGARFQVDLFCGWFMRSMSERIGISRQTSMALGERGIDVETCLYAPDEQDYERFADELRRFRAEEGNSPADPAA